MLSSSEAMTNVYRVYVGIATVLALCKYSLAGWNVTEESAKGTVSPCHRHGNPDNCTDTIETGNGHFSVCPKELKHYCIHGACRYIQQQKAPSCRCERGYVGSRCEYVDLDWQIGDKKHIIIACVVAFLVALILIIVLICMCSHRRYARCKRRRRQRQEPVNGTEKGSMMDTREMHRTLSEPSEVLHTDAV
ncbi:probetacellulin [Thalassophryne amazonica]|uniref:probetacellulin n=1 Tax=Thalassophryne amazonica TaxID=390379 RepID=UPI001470FA5E|nr:probetacellulin [Thalassophryne amazonica]